MANTGRPRKEIDEKAFEKLCGLQCTKQEIADFFACSDDTIERWCKRTYKKPFAVVFAQKRGLGKVSLRRMQFKLAEKSATMAIWLGKQYLGQTDVQEKNVTVDVDDKFIEALESTAATDWSDADGTKNI